MLKRVLLGLVLAALGGGAWWWSTRLDRLVARNTPYPSTIFDEDMDLLVAKSADPRAQKLLLYEADFMSNSCDDYNRERVARAIEGLAKHPPPVDDRVVDVIAKIDTLYPDAPGLPALATMAKASPHAKLAYAYQLGHVPGDFYKLGDAKLGAQLDRALATIDALGGQRELATVAALVSVRMHSTPTPTITARLRALADDPILAEAWLRLFEERGEYPYRDAELQRFIAGAAPALRAHPPTVSKAIWKQLVRLAYWGDPGALELARLLPHAADELATMENVPGAFLASLRGGGYDAHALEKILLDLHEEEKPNQQAYQLELEAKRLKFDTHIALPESHKLDVGIVVGMGPRAVPELKKWAQASERMRARLAAQALGRLSPEALIECALFDIDVYERLDSETTHVAMSGTIVETFDALASVEGPAAAVPLFRGLASTDSDLATYALKQIETRFAKTPEALVDAVFHFLSRREKFKRREIDAVEKAITTSGPKAGTGVRQNLERLLEEQKGDPDKVFWALKVVGLETCEVVCGADAVPVLRKYALDPGAYEKLSTEIDRNGKEGQTTRVQQPFADLAKKTLTRLGATP